ncbi:MAG: S41 family peptidase [Salinivirgaceae bacterium]|jgi:tricorn protease|nr:S41 family peptidase [Salinivirgaceae bacterium]
MYKNTISIILILIFSNAVIAQTPLWMRYPAISPDGNKIAFCYQGNIYKVNADGGDAFPLTMSEEHCFKPVWSPDGSKIAFASKKYGNYDIFIMNADGSSLKRLTFYSRDEIPFSFSNSGESIIYKTHFLFDENSAVYPLFYNQVYEADIETGHISQLLSIPANNISLSKDKNLVLFEDVKGHYSYFRKHDKSPVARDIWAFDAKSDEFTKLTNFEGEDRNPCFDNSHDTVYYLSEQFNSNFNVCKFPLSNPGNVRQVTYHENHPVRSLTISKNNDLCYSYNGEIYLKKTNSVPAKVPISINVSPFGRRTDYNVLRSGVTDFDVSPDGKEIAFVLRGNIYVTSFLFKTTRQITKTNEIDRDVSYAPDGRSLIYSSLRNGDWNIYETKIVEQDAHSFLYGTLLEEHPVLESKKAEVAPKYSPDGNYIAYYEDWNTLMLYDVANKTKKVVLPDHKSYIYSDNMPDIEWSPNSMWLLFEYSPRFLFKKEIGVVKVTNPEKVINLTQSGYNDVNPKWGSRSNMFIWLSNRDGYRDHANYRANREVYAGFFTQKGFEVFNMSEENFLLYRSDSMRVWMNHKYELDKVLQRQVRLTTNSNEMTNAILSKDDNTLFYFCKNDKMYDLWTMNIRKRSSKMVQRFNGVPVNDKLSADGNYLFFLSSGKIYYANTSTYGIGRVHFEAEKTIDYLDEKKIVFDEFFRLIKDKFYTEDLHGTDWDFYKQEYEKFLPHINNDIDFAEMLSEMMGELNVSHSGVRYVGRQSGRDGTASLGFFPDYDFKGEGVKIAEIIEGGPLTRFDSEITNGNVITAIDGDEVKNLNHFFQLMNHKTGNLIRVSLYDRKRKESWSEMVNPIGSSKENDLLYQRWVKQREMQVEALSNGRLGYVHIKSMSVQTFRRIYSDALGKYADKEALIVDIRTSSGGWIHDALLTLLNGDKYAVFYHRGEYSGSEPANKWYKPSILIMNENSRSDASGFAHFYKELGIGKIVGMPNQGTFSGVVRVSAMNPLLRYYIPYVGAKDNDGEYLENQNLSPDIQIRNNYSNILEGEDSQLQTTIQLLLKEIDQLK